MTGATLLWNVAFFLLTGTLLVLPFYPAWREWRHPADAQPLPLPDAPPGASTAILAQVTLDLGEPPRPVVKATERISVPVGSAFFKLVAPVIELGTPSPASESRGPERPLGWLRATPLLSLPGGQTWGIKGHRVKGPCQVPEARHLTGPLVVLGTLTIGADCVIAGDIKAHGAIHIGARSLVTGSVFSPHDISLAEGARVQGAILSEDRIRLSARCVVGQVAQPASVSARRIEAASGSGVHGTLWAREGGQVT